MISSKKALVSISIAVGFLAFGAAASALDGSAQDPVLGDTTSTTLDDTTSTGVSSTTVEDPIPSDATTTTVVETTSTVLETTTTVGMPDSEAPEPDAASEGAANAFGQCTAFSGRPQPGNSQAWQRLYDVAGGDIEAYCANVFVERDGRGTGTQGESGAEESELDDIERQEGRGRSAETPGTEDRGKRAGHNNGKPGR